MSNHKETGDRVSSLAGKYGNFQPIDLTRLHSDQQILEFCADIRSMAASLRSQDQTKGKRKKDK